MLRLASNVFFFFTETALSVMASISFLTLVLLGLYSFEGTNCLLMCSGNLMAFIISLELFGSNTR